MVLISARARFRRRASLIEQRFSVSWVVAVLLVLGAAVWLVLFAYRHVPYSKELWWQFAFEAPAPRSLRALLLAAMTAAAYALYRLLRPHKPPIMPPSGSDLERGFTIARNAGAVALGFQVEFQALCQMVFVLHDEDMRRSAHTVAPRSNLPPGVRMRGSCRWIVEPRPSPGLSAKASPPCCRAMERTRKRPSPVPFTRRMLRLGTR